MLDYWDWSVPLSIELCTVYTHMVAAYSSTIPEFAVVSVDSNLTMCTFEHKLTVTHVYSHISHEFHRGPSSGVNITSYLHCRTV